MIPNFEFSLGNSSGLLDFFSSLDVMGLILIYLFKMECVTHTWVPFTHAKKNGSTKSGRSIPGMV